MQSDYKINSTLFNSLNENIKDPFLVLDSNGNVLTHNKAALSLFSFSADHINLFDILDDASSEKTHSLISKAIKSTEPVVENINLTLKSGKEIQTQVTINSYSEENEVFLFVTLRDEKMKIHPAGLTELNVVTDNLKLVLNDADLFGLLENVKSSYPFTFIGKEKIRKNIDKLDEFFWIKDGNGVFVIVNNKFSKGFGLKSSNLEGKPEKSFLPSYLIGFYGAVDKYMQESLNSVILRGVMFNGIISSESDQIIQIPLIDADNKVIAVVCVGRNLDKVKKSSESDFFNTPVNFIGNLQRAIAFLDINGNIRHESEEFSKLFKLESGDLLEKNYKEIFPIFVSERLERFYNSTLDKEDFEISGHTILRRESKNNYCVYLSKIYSKKNQLEGVSVLIEDTISGDDIEKIINSRGRMFEALIQNNPEPIFIYDTENLRFLEVNEASLALYGYRRDEFLQMDLTDLYTPEDIQTLLDTSNAAAKEGKFTGPYRHKKKDGSSVYVEISKLIFTFNDKDAHFNIIKDVTEKLDLEKKNQLFKAAFDNTDNLLFITDNSGFITFANNAALSLLGLTKKEIEKSSFASIVKDDDRGIVNTTIFSSHIHEAVSLNTFLKKSTNEFVPAEVTATPILNYNKEVDSFIIIGKLERGKESAAESAAVKEVIVEKPVYKDAAQPYSSSPAFLSSLFHEILTPINVILGFIQELTQSIGNLSEEQKESVDIINQNRERLLNTMNSVMEYSQIEGNDVKIKTEEITITEVIDKLQNEIDEIFGSMGAEFAYGKISSSLKFETDLQKLQTFIILLLKIVMAISKEKKLYFSAYQNDDDYFLITIKDNYNSVSKYLLDNLITLFTKDDSAVTKDFGLSKLSIKLAKSLLNILKGRFELLDKQSKADFGFLFPIKFTGTTASSSYIDKEGEDTKTVSTSSDIMEVSDDAAKEEFEYQPPVVERRIEAEGQEDALVREAGLGGKSKDKQTSSDRLDLSQLTCLYIEDQVDSQILFKVQMKELKDIKFAVSFEEALPLLENYHFDFIVMDINLQGEYNGLDALRIIHKMPNLENIPIVAVTAYVLPGDKEKFIIAGFSDFISKPIFREKMIDSLEKIFLMQI